jgi:hypothetical protein
MRSILILAITLSMQTMQDHRMMQNHPMQVEGTTVTAADTPTGIALTFTTKPENVAELRNHLERMTLMNGSDGTTYGMMHGQSARATVKYEAVDSGAKLTLTPKDASKVEEFRTQVRTAVERMNKGESPIMRELMPALMGRPHST